MANGGKVKRLKNGQCRGCNAWHSNDGKYCTDCSAPPVVTMRRAVRAHYRPEPDGLVVANMPQEHGPSMCEDAPACAVCREMMGLPSAVHGLG